ncbi:MAG TPA: Clp protease N-terminal domain-containing protein, partial [Terriglobia bacterium]|nr:Clp protease N-terminal domain-containing protein [Terriglobia bacterium]
MFERYTETARRTIFFARYSASQYGSRTIETEHLLLGILREDPNLIRRFLPSRSNENIRGEVEKYLTMRPKLSTSIDMPLSNECKRILASALEEADMLDHRRIGAEHLLLGILREHESAASQVLHSAGLNLPVLRLQLGLHEGMTHNVNVFALPKDGCVPDAATAIVIAGAVWLPIYGADIVNSQQPFLATLSDET